MYQDRFKIPATIVIGKNFYTTIRFIDILVSRVMIFMRYEITENGRKKFTVKKKESKMKEKLEKEKKRYANNVDYIYDLST